MSVRLPRKIICTLGPASLTPKVLRRLGDLGVDLFRLNLSHSDPARLAGWVELIRAHSNVPVCFDTQGAQVRTGSLSGGAFDLAANAIIELVPATEAGHQGRLPIYPLHVVNGLRVGDLLSVDFDSVLLQVIETGAACRARVLCAGRVGSNKAVTVDAPVVLDPLTPVDVAALGLGRELGLRQVALSFTNRRSDVEAARAVAGSDAWIIAKVETRQALDNLDEILDAADAILIDRGDLSREIPLESIPLVQKEIIRRANAHGTPVYVATNLLESMVTGLRPTRAEVNDVMNTLIDGADGLVLAAETAIGRNPVGCVAMVRALIDQFDQHDTAVGAPWSLPRTAMSSSLIAPHGGRLSIRVTTADAAGFQTLAVDERVMMDVRQLACGAFSPVDGFMDRETLESVLDRHRLPAGTVWPMPIVLPVNPTVARAISAGETIALANGGVTRGVLHVTSVFTWDLRDLARRWFGTTDLAHPGVARLLAGPDTFLAGPVDVLEDEARRLQAFELTPSQARKVFDHRQWQRVVGFHTRNVPHRVHEHLQLTALADFHCDGILVHPVIGPKKSGDCTGDIILKCYDTLIRAHYPPNSAMVAGWVTYSRYAGPREALFTALVRQNYGCSHFIVGRDHTGVGQFYEAAASRALCESFAGEIGIQLAFAPEYYYCPSCRIYVSACAHDRADAMSISGTGAREMLRGGRRPPEWFMREDVAQVMLDELARGTEIFVP